MIPFKDDNPTRTFPIFTIGIILVNIIVFLLQITSPLGTKRIVYSYGAIPHLLLRFEYIQPIHPFLTVFTSMFMHGGIFHLFSNMLYLWIFGNNIEDKLGHIRFLIFYLICGIVAAYSHAITEPKSMIPMIGASGAISGILGAYALLFPHARVHTIIFLGFFVQVVRLPAFFVLGFWIVIQFINGVLSKGVMGQGGVAWFAHIGGFLFGLFTIRLFLKKRYMRL
ncbi:MAG: rhomboid family intramembrane serine protease [Thermodesulfovibrionia bacterium]